MKRFWLALPVIGSLCLSGLAGGQEDLPPRSEQAAVEEDAHRHAIREKMDVLIAELANLQQSEAVQREKAAAIKAQLEAFAQHKSGNQTHHTDFVELLVAEQRPALAIRQATQELADAMSMLSGHLERVERMAGEAGFASDELRDELREAMQKMEAAAQSLMAAVKKLAAAAPEPAEGDLSGGHARTRSLMRWLDAARDEVESPNEDQSQAVEAQRAQASLLSLVANQNARAEESRLRAVELARAAKLHADRAEQARAEAEKARAVAEEEAGGHDRFRELEQRLQRIEQALEKLAADRGA